MYRGCAAAIACLLIAVPCFAGEMKSDDAVRAIELYEVRLKAAVERHERTLDVTRKKYVNDLERAKREAERDGNSDEARAIQQRIDAVESEMGAKPASADRDDDDDDDDRDDDDGEDDRPFNDNMPLMKLESEHALRAAELFEIRLKSVTDQHHKAIGLVRVKLKVALEQAMAKADGDGNVDEVAAIRERLDALAKEIAAEPDDVEGNDAHEADGIASSAAELFNAKSGDDGKADEGDGESQLDTRRATPRRSLVLVSEGLTSKRAPMETATGAIFFDAPKGSGRSGANGFAIRFPRDYKEKGSQVAFKYTGIRNAQGFQIVHPYKDGHVICTLNRVAQKFYVTTGRRWDKIGWGNRSRLEAKVYAGIDHVQYDEGTIGTFMTEVTDDGIFELSINRHVVLRATLPDNVDPFEFTEDFGGADLPDKLPARWGLIIIGPHDQGVSEMRAIHIGS